MQRTEPGGTRRRRCGRLAALVAASPIFAALLGDPVFAAAADPEPPVAAPAADTAAAGTSQAADSNAADTTPPPEDTEVAEDEEFIPTEELSRDRTFDFPVDI